MENISYCFFFNLLLFTLCIYITLPSPVIIKIQHIKHIAYVAITCKNAIYKIIKYDCKLYKASIVFEPPKDYAQKML